VGKSANGRHMPLLTVLKPFGPPELSFVRASMRALSGGRRGCEHCHRTPLLGETIYLYGDRIVCELCRPLRREAPGREEMVHSAERDHSVKRRFAA
jgi:hypothetical protein